MRLPVRVRLTAWYAGLLALAIAALAAFVVVRLRADLTAGSDRSLRSGSAQIRQAYERAGAPGLDRLSGSVLHVLPGDAGLQLVSAGGSLERVSGPDLPRAPLITAAQRGRVLGGHDLVYTAHGPSDSEPFRVLATRVSRDGSHRALLVASSLESVDAAAAGALKLVLIAGPFLLLLTAAGGWLLAGRALRPVARLTEHAARIEVDRLDERVPVPRAQDEIASLAVTLNHMLDRLGRGVEDKRRLVADASHELRTPLAVMRSELDVALAYDDLEPSAYRVLASVRDEADRMSRIVADLLTLARVDEGGLELVRKAVDLREVAADVAQDLGSVAAENDVLLAAGGEPALVEADAERVRQVVTNLVANAVKYSHPGGAVTVTSWQRGAEAGVSVADEGVGIPAAELGHVFDRFYRVGAARVRDSGGSGLGLAICREIALAHGGRVWAESEDGRGSRFHLALPAAASGLADRSRDDAEGAARRTAPASG